MEALLERKPVVTENARENVAAFFEVLKGARCGFTAWLAAAKIIVSKGQKLSEQRLW